MPLTPGTRLGSYEIRGALGAGGFVRNWVRELEELFSDADHSR